MADEPVELRIQLLGGFRVSLGNQEIPTIRWRLTKARSLVKLLALTPRHCLHRDQLIDILWPELDLNAAANNLYQVLYTTRRILEPDGTHCYLQFQSEELHLCPEGAVWIDVEAFRAAVSRAQGSRNPADYRAALKLYSGNLLPEDQYSDWAELPRQALCQEYQSLKLALAHLLERLGDYATAIETLREVHANDPACEEAYVGLMRCFALVGQRQQALRLYQLLKEILRRELEVEPSHESTHLYQEILTGRFPPNKVSEKVRPLNNLPRQLTSFIGREAEITQIKKLLGSSRLVTLTGAGGVGKTRLALEAVEGLLEEYYQGVWLVDLSPLVDAQLVLQAVTTIFGVQESRDRNLTMTLLDYLHEKQILLLLDNCEHLIESCAYLAKQILHTCPKIHILATSREALGITGEVIYVVQPLALPDTHRLPPLERILEYDAVRLFIERAASALPDFKLTETNSAPIIQICQQLDGLPLALELAAAQVRTLGVNQIAARLKNVFRFLVGGNRTALPRHQTLHTLIDWSYNLLSETERRLFQRLAVFEGGWTLEAAEALWGKGDENIYNLLTQLITKSLVVAKLQQGDVDRYLMLETIRQYARGKLEESGEAERVRDAHKGYFLRLAGDIAPKLRAEDSSILLDRLDEEIGNLRAALCWTLEEAPGLRIGEGLEIASVLLLYWYLRGSVREGLEWLKKGLSLRESYEIEQRKHRADACLAVGVLLEHTNPEEACQFLDESIRLYQAVSDSKQASHAQCQLGHALVCIDSREVTNTELAKARAIAEEGLATCRQSGDKWSLAFALCMNAIIVSKTDVPASLGLMKESHKLFHELGDKLFLEITTAFFSAMNLHQGDYATGMRYGQQSLELARALKSKRVIMLHLSNIGIAAWFLKDYSQMAACFQEKLTLSSELGEKAEIALSLRFLGMANLRLGHIQEASACFLEGLQKAQEVGNEHVWLFILWLAGVALAMGQPARTVRLMATIRSKIEAGTNGMDSWDQQEFEQIMATVKAPGGDEAVQAALEKITIFSEDEAFAEAIAIGKEASQTS
jgi:predicted ATPase/DNA-binding SARP family transcriptional activator